MKVYKRNRWIIATICVLLSTVLTVGMITTFANSADDVAAPATESGSPLGNSDDNNIIDDKVDDNTTLGASSYKVTIDKTPDNDKDEAYFLDLSQKAGKEVDSFFTVTYEKDGQTVRVNNGDMVPAGTTITAEVNTIHGGGYMAINDRTKDIPYMSDQYVNVVAEFAINEDTEIKKAFVSIMPLAAYSGDDPRTHGGAGLYSGVIAAFPNNTLEKTVTESKNQVYTYNHTWSRYRYVYDSWNSTWVHELDTPNANGTDTYFDSAQYDAFNIKLDGGTYSLSSAALAGRRIKLTGTGHVDFGNFAFDNYTQFGKAGISVTQAIIIEDNVTISGTFTGNGSLIFNTGNNNNTHGGISVSGSGVTVAGNAKHITSSGDISFLNESKGAGVSLTGNIYTWVGGGGGGRYDKCNTHGIENDTRTGAKQATHEAAPLNGTHGALPATLALTATGSINIDTFNTATTTTFSSLKANAINILSSKVNVTMFINANNLTTGSTSQLTVTAPASFVNVWGRSTYNGDVLITDQFGPTTVEIGARGNIDNLYARGSAELNSLNVNYQKVFGGGTTRTTTPTTTNDDYSTNLGSVDINMSAGTIANEFYGGGDGTSVGATDISVTGGKIDPDIYGGSKSGAAVTSSSVTMSISGATTIGANIYTGGHGAGAGSSSVSGLASLTLSSLSVPSGSVYGGGNSSTGVTSVGSVLMNNTGTTTISGSLYGGGNADAANSTVLGNVDITNTNVNVSGSFFGGGISTNGDATVAGSVSINHTGPVAGDVFGGGTGTATKAPITGHVALTLSGSVGGDIHGGGNDSPINNSSGFDPAVSLVLNNVTTTAAKNVYGGSKSALVGGNVSITQAGGTIAGNLYGGGNALTANANVNGGVIINTNSSINGFFYGGGNALLADAEVSGDISVTTSSNIGKSFYGGGISDAANSAKVDGKITIVKTAGSISDDFFGGGTSTTNGNASVGKNISVTLSGSVGGDVYGGGNDNPVRNSSNFNPAVSLVLDSLNVTNSAKNVYGGSKNGLVGGNISITQNAGSISGNLYGGGNALVQSSTTNGDVTITTTGSIGGYLYGGGISAVGDANINGRVKITQSAGNIGKDVFGGGTGTNSTTEKYTELELNGTIRGNVYGGGDINPINNTGNHPFATSVKLGGNISTANTNLYGGGKEAIVKGNIKVETTPNSSVNGNVYGGGIGSGSNDANVAGYTNVTVAGTVQGTVFGGGINGSDIRDYTNVTVDSRGTDKVHGNVYGGGADAISKISSKDASNNSTTVLINGNVGLNVYGGSNQSEIPFSTLVTLQTAAYGDYTVEGNLYGGSHTNLTNINGYTRVKLNGGTINGFVYGGGSDGSEVKNNTPNDTFATIVSIAGSRIKQTVYGGGEMVGANASPIARGSSKVDMTSGHVLGNIYGGGLDSEVKNYAEVYVGNTTNTGECIVEQDVYGGGYGPGGNILDGTKGTLVVIRETGVVNNRVFGGGHDDANIVGSDGTKVDIYGEVGLHVFGGGNKADLSSTAVQGTNVTVYASGTVKHDVFGGGLDAIVDSQETTDVLIRGKVLRDVYGGGYSADASGTFVSDITKVRGPFVKVTGKDAFVGHNVYGGGYGEKAAATAQNTDVSVTDGANVVYAVFGGGRGADGDGAGTFGSVAINTNVVVSGAETVIGNKAIVTDILVTNNHLIGCNTFYDRGIVEDGAGVTSGTPGCLISRWTNVGNVYGGGSWATIGGDTKVTISGTKQKSFNRISGGNMGLQSTNPERNIHLFNLGEGVSRTKTSDEERADLSFYYTDLQYYSAIRFLQDYKVTNAHDSYLTVYYHLKSTDDARSTLGLHNQHDSDLNMYSGIYNPWRPQDHTVVRVEPKINIHDYGKFRVEAGYTITLDDGIFTTNKMDRPNYLEDRIRLLIDSPIVDGVRSKDNSGTTSKLYGPNDNIMERNIFTYPELPRTTVPSNLRDQNAHFVTGTNVYIPPMNIDNEGVKPTSPGGSSGSGSGSGRGGGGGSVYSGGGGGNPSVTISGYKTDENKLVDHSIAVKLAEATAKQVNSSKNAVVVEKSSGKINVKTLKEMQKAAQKHTKDAVLYGDTVYGNKVEGRIYIYASRLDKQKDNEDINLGVFTGYSKTARTSKIFSTYFKNKVAIVSLAQKGSYGMDVKIAANVNLDGLDTKNLILYVYDTNSNNYSKLANQKYSIDSSGYIHFTTSVGGDIIIADKALTRK